MIGVNFSGLFESGQKTDLLASALLTGRSSWETFDKFDTWWADIEKAGSEKEILANGFHDSKTVKEISQCLKKLTSGKYAIREQARKRLFQLCPPIPESVYKAAKGVNPEVALAASHVIDREKVRSAEIRKILAEKKITLKR